MAGELHVRADGQVRRFGPDRPVRVARDRSADVPVGDPLVSREHLVLECPPAGWILRDTGNTRDDHRIVWEQPMSWPHYFRYPTAHTWSQPARPRRARAPA